MPSFSDICAEISPLKKIPLSIRYMLLSTFAFAFMNALIKYLIHFPTFELVFFAHWGLYYSLYFYCVLKISLVPNQPKLLILRGIMG